MGREGGCPSPEDDGSKRNGASNTRSTTDAPRLTADRRRTKTLNRGRWRVVALEWRGYAGGGKDRSTYVASRGGRCPWDPMDTGNRWEYTRREYIQGESFRRASTSLNNNSFFNNLFYKGTGWGWISCTGENLILIKWRREESGNECFMDVFLGGGGGKINVSSLFSRDERLNLIEIEFY